MQEALFDIGLLIVCAKVAEGILGRLGLSSIIAYTGVGILFGPLTGVIRLTDPHLRDELDLFLHIGVFLFFFLVGLEEIDLASLKATLRGRFFLAAAISVSVSMAVALSTTSNLFGFGFSLGLDFTDALALSGILSLSSLGLVTKVLADKGQLRTSIGLEIFTLVVIAELIALILVAFALGERDQDPSPVGMLVLVAHIAAFVVVAWVLSAKIVPPAILFIERHFNVPELAFGLINGGLFLVVVGAERMELHGSIGALIFGVALSGMPRRLQRKIAPGMRSAAEGLFVPLFFAAAGLRLDSSFINLPLETIVGLAVIPFVGKFVGAFIGVFLARLDRPYANATGLLAKGVSEIALLLVLVEADIIGQDVFSLLVLVMFSYILLMPPVITFVVSRAAEPHHPTLPAAVPPSYARYALGDMRVRHVMDSTRTYPSSKISVKEFSEYWIVHHEADYVVADNGTLAGVVSLARVQHVPRKSWADTSLAQVLDAGPPCIALEEPVEDALILMSNASTTVIPVVEGGTGKFLGEVTMNNVLETVALLDEIAEELAARGESDDEVGGRARRRTEPRAEAGRG